MEIVTIKTPYITLGQLLKLLALIGSGGEAKIFLQFNEVYVNEILENRRGRKIYPDDVVKINSVDYQIKLK